MTNFCPSCKQHLPASAFHKNAKRKNGLAVYCRQCVWRKYANPQTMFLMIGKNMEEAVKPKMDHRRSRFDYDGIQPVLWRDLLHRY